MIRQSEVELVELERRASRLMDTSKALDNQEPEYVRVDHPGLQDAIAVADAFLEVVQEIRRAGLVKS